MAVILADGTYQVARRAHPWATMDDHGIAVPAALGAYGTARAGAVTAQADRSWRVRLDPAEWPLEAGDRITDGERTWTITGEPRRIRHPVDDEVDYVTATAALDPPEVP